MILDNMLPRHINRQLAAMKEQKQNKAAHKDDAPRKLSLNTGTGAGATNSARAEAGSGGSGGSGGLPNSGSDLALQDISQIRSDTEQKDVSVSARHTLTINTFPATAPALVPQGALLVLQSLVSACAACAACAHADSFFGRCDAFTSHWRCRG